MKYKLMEGEINDISSFIHESALDHHLNLSSLSQICDACNHFNFAGLCTNLVRIPYARKYLGTNKATKLFAVIAFPFGAIPYEIKKSQAEWAAENGADEFDIVPNFLHLHERKIENFAEEIAGIMSMGLPSRVILDTMKIQKEKLILAIEASLDAGATGIQTGNGFGPAITSQHINELNSMTKNRCIIKAAGGVKNFQQAIELINAGATYLGTSAGAELARQFKIHSSKQ